MIDLSADAKVDAAAATLDADEQDRAARFATPLLRRRYVLAHAGLRSVLSRFTGTPPARLSLAREACTACGEPHGKPRLQGPGPAFNLAHSGDTAVVAVAPGRGHTDVGVDLEQLTPAISAPELAAIVLSPDEAATSPRSTRDVLRVWTRKEAALKAIGTGLNVAPHAVTLWPGHPGQHRADAAGRRCEVVDIERLLPADVVGAVAVADAAPASGRGPSR